MICCRAGRHPRYNRLHDHHSRLRPRYRQAYTSVVVASVAQNTLALIFAVIPSFGNSRWNDTGRLHPIHSHIHRQFSPGERVGIEEVCSCTVPTRMIIRMAVRPAPPQRIQELKESRLDYVQQLKRLVYVPGRPETLTHGHSQFPGEPDEVR